MSLSKSGSISRSADHFPACLSHSFIPINPFPPWLNKADAKCSFDGSVILACNHNPDIETSPRMRKGKASLEEESG